MIAETEDGTPRSRWRTRAVGEHTVASRHFASAAADRTSGTSAPDGDRPVVLVHGLVVSSSYHVPLGERLAARGREVHAPDLPGFGRSSRPEQHLDTRELGHVLAGWLDALDLRGVTLVANSYGCQIVAETLLSRPELAERVVLLGPTMERPARQVREQLRRWRAEQKTQSRQLQRLLARDYLTAGIPRAIATFRHALADVIEDKLPYLDQPTLVCRGSRDPIISQAWADEVTQLLPDGRGAVLPGATHAINHEMPLQTARVIEGFLQRTAA
jgi:2-hydroxy-6-oxonona-2,4-dienedioate hydrolase